MNNYSTSRSILAALDSSTISRLHQTWMVRSCKWNPSQLTKCFRREFRRRTSFSLRLYDDWQTIVATIMNIGQGYGIPRRRLFPSSVHRYNVHAVTMLIDSEGLYLTDVIFCREGNPSHRASPINASKKLINFNKYHKLARIVQGPFFS